MDWAADGAAAAQTTARVAVTSRNLFMGCIEFFR
jgi:hypothetical protein